MTRIRVSEDNGRADLLGAADPLVKDDRQAWLAWRREGIGGSDAAAIVGLSPFESAMGIWLQKTGQMPERPATEAMTWGLLLEPIVISEFEARTGLWVGDRQTLRVHPDQEWMRCTLDGVCWPGGEPPATHVFEGKTAGSWLSREWDDGVPEHIQVQVQHELAVTGMERAWVVALVGGQKLVAHELERDESAIGLLMEMEDHFWRSYVLPKVPPPADASSATTEALAAAFPEPQPVGIELDAGAALMVRSIVDIERQIAGLEADREQLRNQLRLMLGTAEVGLFGGRQLVKWGQVTREQFDLDLFKAEHLDLAAHYTKRVQYRALTLSRKEVQ